MMDATLPATSELSASIGRDAAGASDKRHIRVLHVVNRLILGGTESGIINIAAGLGSHDFTHAVCTARGHNPEFVHQRAFSGQIFDATTSTAKFQFLVYRYARIIRKYRPHIVHSRNWGAIEAVFAARLAGVPGIIHSEHGYELHILNGLPARQRVLRRTAYAAANAVFAVTSDLRDYHARQAWVAPAKIDVIPNGVDSERFAPREEMKPARRAELGLPQDSFLIGTVGRLVRIKDQALLIHAAKILMDRGLNISVALAGDGPELQNLRSTAAALGIIDRIHFLGTSRTVSSFLNALDVFVLPSSSEGMSNTVLEAMSSGLPVIATRVGGNPELIENEVSGLLFQVGDAAQLVEHLAALAENDTRRRQLGTAARSRILANYRMDLMLDRYRELYQRLAWRRKPVSVRAT